MLLRKHLKLESFEKRKTGISAASWTSCCVNEEHFCSKEIPPASYYLCLVHVQPAESDPTEASSDPQNFIVQSALYDLAIMEDHPFTMTSFFICSDLLSTFIYEKKRLDPDWEKKCNKNKWRSKRGPTLMIASHHMASHWASLLHCLKQNKREEHNVYAKAKIPKEK